MKLIGYRVRHQLADLLPSLLLSVVMCVAVMAVGYLKVSPLIGLIIQVATGIVVYLALAWITRNSSLRYLLDMLKSRKRH